MTGVWARECQNYEDPFIRQVSYKSTEKEVWETQKMEPQRRLQRCQIDPPFRRRTIRDRAHALNIPKSTLF